MGRNKRDKDWTGREGGGDDAASGSDDSDSDFEQSDDDRCSTPESQKNTTCSVCSKKVNSSDKSLQCDKCNEWCHIKCGDVTKEHYRQMVRLDESNIEIQWHCPPCDKLENPDKHSPSLENSDSNSENHVPTPTAHANMQTKPVTPSGAVAGNTTVRPPTPSTVNTKPRTIIVPPTSRPPPPRTIRVSVPQTTRTVPRTIRVSVPQTIRVSTTNTVRTTPTTIRVSTPTTYRTTTTTTVRTSNQNGRSGAGRLSFPDCKIRELPFYPVKSTLLRPCNLTPKDNSQEPQQQNLAFYLTQEQANTVNNGRKVESNGMVVYKMHILLRFTKMAPDNVHDDDFPKNLILKVNNKVCPLPNPKPVPANRPNMEAKRPPKPLIITSLCKLNTKSCLNQISITWTPTEPTYTVSIYLVEKLTPVDLLTSLKGRGQRDPEITRALIRSKLEDKDQDEIATTSCKVTMSCPLGMARMTYPARASTCDHLQCFDADTYLRMNEKKPKWVCPVCNKPAYFENLFLDGFYIQLLQSQKFRALSTNDIVLNQDASWEPVICEGVGVSDDSEDEDPLAVKPAKPTAEPGDGSSATDGGAAAGTDPDIIPITPDVDADGAPILNQLANLPIAPLSATNPVTNGVKSSKDDDFLKEADLAPEDEFVDWNFSVKFFQFIRDPPTGEMPTGVAYAPVSEPARSSIDDRSPADSEDNSSASSKTKSAPQKTTRGRGRGRGRGAANKRTYDSDDMDYDSSQDEPPKRSRGGRASRGRGVARTASRNSNSSSGAKRQRTSRYVESSPGEESSENEEDVLNRPVQPTTGRPSRNCRRSTNYADIEKAGDVLDYLLN